MARMSVHLSVCLSYSRRDGPSRRLSKTAAVVTVRRDGPFRYHMQFQNSMHGLLRKYYVTDDVLCDAVSSAIWDEKLQNGRKRLLCWQQLPFAFCKNSPLGSLFLCHVLEVWCSHVPQTLVLFVKFY